MTTAVTIERSILIVEDDELTAELERRVLARSGLIVRAVSRAKDAIELLGTVRFGAVVLDYQLPDGDPWSVVDAAQAQTPRVPVIVVTAMGNERVAADALHHGVAEYLQKTEAFLDQLPEVVDRVAKIAEANERLRRTDALFALIARSATDMVTTLDLRGRIKELSEAARHMLGYEPTEVIGMQSLDFVHPDDRQRVARTFAALRDHTRLTYRQRRKDGSYAWVEVNASMLCDSATGAPQEVLGIIRDVTERKLAEEKFRTLLEGLPDANVIIDNTGTIVLVNLRAEQLFGYDRSELLGKPATMLLADSAREQSTQLHTDVVPGVATIGEVGARRKDGHEFPAEVSRSLLETEGMRLISTTVVDISQRRTLQDQELLLEMGQQLPRFEEVDQLVSYVVGRVGVAFGVHRCTFSEIDLKARIATCHADYARSGDSLKGPLPLSTFSALILRDFEQGRPVSATNVTKDARIDREECQRYLSANIHAFAGVPLLRDGVWIGAILVYQDEPRVWATREIQMLQALAERIWLWMEHLRMLRALRDSERQYRRLIEATHEGVWEIDDQQRTRFVNGRMAEMLGYTAAEMLGQPLFAFMDDEGRRIAAEQVERRKAGMSELHDHRFQHKTGRVLWARLTASPLLDENGGYIGALAMVTDVTEQRREEDDRKFLLRLSELLTVTNDQQVALRAAAAQLGTHLNADLCGFVAIDVTTHSMVLRDVWQRTPVQTYEGSYPLDTFGPIINDLASGRHVVLDEIKLQAGARGVLASLGVRAAILVPMHMEGRFVATLAVTSWRQRPWTSREVGLAQATVERTALCVGRLQNIAALRDFNKDLERRVQERTHELEAALREKEVLLKEIHHRVKNNLQVISSMLNLQAHHLPDEQARTMFAESQGRVQSIALVHESLYRAKDLSSVSSAEYLHNLVDSVFHAQSAPGRQIERLVDSQSVRLPVSVAIPCGLIVNELVTNALKHAFPDNRAGNVRVSMTRLPDERIELRVADDGIGLVKDYDPAQSTSLGLELVYTFAEQLGAEVIVTRGQGTEFCLTFSEQE